MESKDPVDVVLVSESVSRFPDVREDEETDIPVPVVSVSLLCLSLSQQIHISIHSSA